MRLKSWYIDTKRNTDKPRHTLSVWLKHHTGSLLHHSTQLHHHAAASSSLMA